MRRSLIRLSVTLAAVVSTTLFTANIALACSCLRPNLWQDFNDSDAVFVGRVLQIEAGGDYGLAVRVEVLRSWRGIDPGLHTIYTWSSGAACGYGFAQGATYLVFAHGEPASLTVGLCGSTQRVDDVRGAEAVLARVETSSVDTAGGGVEGVRVSSSDIGVPGVEQSNARRLTDLFWPVAGVYPLRLSRAASGYTIRGLSGRHALTVQDGIRLNTSILGDTFYSSVDPNTGMMDLRSFSQIRVLRGARSTRWGSGAVGGVVELTSQRPGSIDEGAYVSLLNRFSTNELAYDTSARLEAALGPVSVLGGFTFLLSNDLHTGQPSDLDVETAYLQYGGDAQVRVRTGAGSLTAAYSGLRQSPKREERDPSSFDPDERLRDLVWLGWEQIDAADWLSLLDIKLAYMRQCSSWADETPEARSQTVNRLTLAAAAESPLGDQLRLSWGADVDVELLAVDGDSASRLVDGSRHTLVSGWSELWADLADRTALQFGGRVAWTGAHVPATNEAGSLELSSPTGSFQVNFMQTLADWLDVFVSTSTAYSAPSLRELVPPERTPQGTSVPNVDLRSEQIINLEAGLSLGMEPFSIDVTGYYAFGFDFITLANTGMADPGNLDDFGAPLPIYRPENVDEARLYGIESALDFYLGALLFRASVNWNRGDNRTIGEPLPHMPPIHGVFGLYYTTPSWSAGAYSRYAASQRDVPTGETTVDGYAIFGLRGHFRWASWGYLVISLDNLGNQSYRTPGSAIPEAGFDATFTLYLEFP